MDPLGHHSASVSLISENEEAFNHQFTKIRTMQAELQEKAMEISGVLQSAEELHRTVCGAIDENLKEHEEFFQALKKDADAEIQKATKDFETGVDEILYQLNASTQVLNQEIAAQFPDAEIQKATKDFQTGVDEICSEQRRGENPDIREGGGSRAVRGDLLTSLITSSRTLIGTVGLYIASTVWKGKTRYSGLYLSAMVLFLHWTLYLYPTVRQYRILKRRHSTCRPQLKRPLEIQMRTLYIKSDFVAALTCIVLYHSWLTCERYDH